MTIQTLLFAIILATVACTSANISQQEEYPPPEWPPDLRFVATYVDDTTTKIGVVGPPDLAKQISLVLNEGQDSESVCSFSQRWDPTYTPISQTSLYQCDTPPTDPTQIQTVTLTQFNSQQNCAPVTISSALTDTGQPITFATAPCGNTLPQATGQEPAPQTPDQP